MRDEGHDSHRTVVGVVDKVVGFFAGLESVAETEVFVWLKVGLGDEYLPSKLVELLGVGVNLMRSREEGQQFSCGLYEYSDIPLAFFERFCWRVEFVEADLLSGQGGHVARSHRRT